MIGELQIRCFLAVARTLNFTQAAVSLFITQQACSKYISSLEKDLGFPLFVRSTRRVSLTPEGEMMYALFARFADEYRDACDSALRNLENKRSPLHLGIMGGTSTTVFSHLLIEFAHQNPSIELDWQFSQPEHLGALVLNHGIDAAFVYTDVLKTYPTLQSMQLHKIQAHVLLSPKYVSKNGELDLSLLKSMSFGAHLIYNSDEAQSRAAAEAIIQMFDLPYADVRLFNNVEEALLAVELGECYTIANEMLPMFYSPYVAKIPLPYRAGLACIWNEHSHSPQLYKLLSFLKEHQSQLAGMN